MLELTAEIISFHVALVVSLQTVPIAGETVRLPGYRIAALINFH